MRLFFSLLVCCAALICSIGCGSDTTSSQNGNSIESLPVRRVVDTIIHTDSIVSKRLLFSKSDSVHEKYSRYIISGKRYTNTYDDSTRVIRYESIDTLVIASFIITMVNPTTLIVKKDTIVQIDTLSGVTKMNSTEKIYRDTVDDVLAVVDTQFTMFVIATTSDFLTGNMAIAGAGGNFPAKSSLLPIHSDSRVQTYGGSVYIIERFTKDNIIRINGSTISPATIAYQHHLGDGVNLHDIAFISETKAYVTQYNSADLLVFNPATGTVIDSISLAGFNTYAGTDSAQAVPFMESSLIVGNKAYILCQRLKVQGTSFVMSSQPGVIAVISTVTDSIIDTITTVKKNPAAMSFVDGHLYVSCTGSWYDSTDGGIDKISCTTDSCLGTVIQEAAFGGNIGNLAMVSGTKGYVAVSGFNATMTKFWTVLKEFNPNAALVGPQVKAVENAFGGLVYDGTYLFVGERSEESPGIIVINPEENKKIGSTLAIGLPSSLAVLELN